MTSFFKSILIIFYALGISLPILAQDSLRNQVPAKGLNTDDHVEYSPTISADGKTMIFQSDREQSGSYKIYESKLGEDGVWSTPASLDKINNYSSSNDLIGGPSLSFDGNFLLFFASFDDGFGREDIYYSTREANGWSAPINLGETVNSSGYEAFPSISADFKTLYFVKERVIDDVENKTVRKSLNFAYAIYQSNRSTEGVWSTPKELSSTINLYSTKAPRIMADNQTLIFSAIRSEEKLDYDLFQSQKNILGDWSLPVNLGYVNTSKSDQHSCISASGDLMYFVYASKDIYTVEIPEKYRQFVNNVVTGTITDQDTKNGVETDIIITDARTTKEIMRTKSSPADGKYALVLAAGKNYNIEFRADGYSSFTSSYDLRNTKKYKEYSLDIELFTSAKLTLTVSDLELFEALESDVKFKKQGASSFLEELKTSKKDGRIVLNLPLGQVYEVFISKPHFKGASFPLDLTGLIIYRDYEKDLELQPEKVRIFLDVADIKNNSKIRSKIIIRNKSRDEVIEAYGNEFVQLRAGDRYEIESTSSDGYAFNSTTIDLTTEQGAKQAAETKVGMKLTKLEKDAKLTLKNINFESNSVQLSEGSYIELLRVVKLMIENPTLKVEVAAHTDDVGSAQYNTILSDRRAQSVVDYLIDNQVASVKFIAKGYGESVPLVTNDSDENRAKNRRVELKILAIK